MTSILRRVLSLLRLMFSGFFKMDGTPDWERFEHGDGNRRLVIYLHGLNAEENRNRSLLQTVRSEMPGADIYSPRLPYSWGLSMVPLAHVTFQLLKHVDELWASKQNRDGFHYEDVVVIGHSLGAVIARKLLVCAHGEVTWKSYSNTDEVWQPAPFEEELAGSVCRDWAPSVSRLVLLAAMSRGWSINDVRSPAWAALMRVGVLFGQLFPKQPAIFELRRGAPFVSQTRLQWLALVDPRGDLEPRDYQPSRVIVAQLLGTVDNAVSPDDTLDFALDHQDPTFFLIQVPSSNHVSLLDMTESSLASDPRAIRRQLFSTALTGSAQEIAAIATPREYVSEQLPPPPDYDVKHAVFVIHGIRDLGFWTQKIAAEIKRQSNGTVKSISPSYGFFAMAPFILPWVRRQKAEWFMDLYVQARARYPHAEFSYVAHSNGTYILARALEQNPACRFRHVVFAGSVVRSDYDWRTKIANGRVRKVLNYVATRDWVVAGFPFAVRSLRSFDLGGAGHIGFLDNSDAVANSMFIRGSHGAGIQEDHWDDIARFVLDGTVPQEDPSTHSPTQPSWIKRLGKWSPWLLLIATTTLLCFYLRFGYYALFTADSAGPAVGFIGLSWLIWAVLNKL